MFQTLWTNNDFYFKLGFALKLFVLSKADFKCQWPFERSSLNNKTKKYFQVILICETSRYAFYFISKTLIYVTVDSLISQAKTAQSLRKITSLVFPSRTGNRRSLLDSHFSIRLLHIKKGEDITLLECTLESALMTTVTCRWDAATSIQSNA